MKIVCATDLMPKSDPALERAGYLSAALDAELALVHAVPPGAPDGTLEQRLRCANDRLTARISRPGWRWGSGHDIAVHCGHPGRVVLNFAYRLNADLLILGPHHDDPFADAIGGTITEKVLGAAACPVLIVRSEPRGDYRHVLVALDGAPHSAVVLREFEALSLLQDGFATALHAHEPPYEGMMNTVGVGAASIAGYAQASHEQAIGHLRKIVQSNSRDPRRYRTTIVEGRPATGILRAIERLGPDLLVMGTRGHGRFRRALSGSIANQVMSASTCDTLLVPERVARTARVRQSSQSMGSNASSVTVERRQREAPGSRV